VADGLNITIEILTGSKNFKTAARKITGNKGGLNIIVGTCAIGNEVKFKISQLAVIVGSTVWCRTTRWQKNTIPPHVWY
jgi:RecG-like helicase